MRFFLHPNLEQAYRSWFQGVSLLSCRHELLPHVLLFVVRQAPIGARLPHSRSFLITHNDAPQSVGLLWRVISLSQRPLPDNTQHSQQTTHPCPPVRFEPTVSAGERPKTYALDRAANGTGITTYEEPQIWDWHVMDVDCRYNFFL
jgi:hypothetical protein